MALDFSGLEAEMTRTDGEIDSTVLLLKTLFDEFEANKTNPAKIQELVNKGRASADRLAQAIVTYTPGATPA